MYTTYNAVDHASFFSALLSCSNDGCTHINVAYSDCVKSLRVCVCVCDAHNGSATINKYFILYIYILGINENNTNNKTYATHIERQAAAVANTKWYLPYIFNHIPYIITQSHNRNYMHMRIQHWNNESNEERNIKSTTTKKRKKKERSASLETRESVSFVCLRLRTIVKRERFAISTPTTSRTAEGSAVTVTIKIHSRAS